MVYKLNVFDIWYELLWCTKIYYVYVISYVLTKYYMLCQAQSSAPGLDIMLVKQRFLSLSGQVANPASGQILLLITCSVHIHGVCLVYNMYMLMMSLVYTCIDLILLTAGLLGNYPSSAILHWRAWRQLWRCWFTIWSRQYVVCVSPAVQVLPLYAVSHRC